ncbi:MAG: hypothetical protein JXR61_11910 [Prolixibacteraceae bacterium]|nr:hypothetical protein [Prolixibacteraceae bacterium]
MQYIIKYFFSFIFLCGISLISRSEEMKADHLYESGNYFEASIEYERQIFHAKSQDVVNLLKYKKALCYKKMGEYERSLEELQPIFFSNPADSLYQYVSYEQALCNFLKGDAARALWKIDEYFHQSKDSASFYNFLPIKILALNETMKWEEAKLSFMQFIEIQNLSPEKQMEMEQIVNEIYSKKNLPKIKSEKKAENWSRFLPGSGQMYAGNVGEGVINFLINASVLTFAGIQAYNGFYITGYLGGLGFLNKTYHGGIKRAGVLATQKSKTEMSNFNQEINAVIISSFDQE